MIRELTDLELDILAEARARVIRRSPYLAAALYRLRVCVVSVGDGVTAGGRIMLSEETMTGPTTHIADLLEHNLWHVLRMHEPRMRHYRDADRSAIASCCEIADDIGAAGGPHPADFNLPVDQTAETYYDMLGAISDDELGLNGDGDGDGEGEEGGGRPIVGHGTGGGGRPLPDEPSRLEDQIDVEGDGLSDVEIETIRRAVADAIRSMPPGDTPGGMLRWADDVLEPPKVPWQQELLAITGTAANAAAGRADWSFRRPSRRPSHNDLVRPSMVSSSPTVGVVIDTSGSMEQADLNEAVKEIVGILQAAIEVIVWSCDAEVGDGVTVRSIRDVQLQGGGGTDMSAGIAAAIADGRPDCVVVVTDGWTPHPAVDPGLPVIYAIVPGGCRESYPSWAKIIYID